MKPYPLSPYADRPPLETPALTVDGLLFARGRILLVQRGRPPWKGRWALPGGFVEIGETCERAVAREFQEETSVHVRPTGLVGVYSDPGRDPRGHMVTVAFRVARVGGTPLGGDDAAEARWFSLAHLPPLAADHARIIRDALRQGTRTAVRRRTLTPRAPRGRRV
ncbi:MAG: NUDIX hydrolase [Euryarchaeota archaeon]|nr:NUDIX hydrolase [Euryarchaeota archaeon]MDE1879145.1 NUDIX hydrolase [Euryarchaeota archaeon]